MSTPKFLVYGGATGWIGAMLVQQLQQKGIDVVAAAARIEQREAVEAELDRVQPSHVINAAGVTGRPNVDWCESNQAETVRSNMIGALTIFDVCQTRGIHVTYFGTGCIYTYDVVYPEGYAVKETDAPNFSGSFYSRTKGCVDRVIPAYDNVLCLRLRMPISDDLHHRSLVTKLLGYKRIVSIPNSVSVLADLLPCSIDMALKRRTGIYNFTNPGAVTHPQLLQLYKDIVDPSVTWEVFDLDQQALVIKAPRSNTELDCSKLLAEYPHIPPAAAAIAACFHRMAQANRSGQ